MNNGGAAVGALLGPQQRRLEANTSRTPQEGQQVIGANNGQQASCPDCHMASGRMLAQRQEAAAAAAAAATHILY